jgi:hypothetical protein
VDHTGAPMVGFKVGLSDAEGALDQRVAPQVVNADGYVTVTLRTGELPALFAKENRVFIRVLNTRNAEVYAPEDGAVVEPGTVATFSAVVDSTPIKVAPGPKKTRRAATKKR